MRNFKVKNSRNRKIVGFPYQTNGYISGYDEKSPNSRTNLTYEKFPDFVPDLRFELHEKSKSPKYDVLHFGDICGFVYISEVLVNKINENKISGFDILEDFDFKVSL